MASNEEVARASVKAAFDPESVTEEELMKLFERRNWVAHLMKTQEADKRTLDEQIIQVLFAHGKTGHKTETFSATIQNRTLRTISREKLIAQGVGIDQIEAATTETTSEPFLVIRTKDEKE